MKKFFTAEFHNTAQKLTLSYPDGKDSEHYIMVLGVQSSQVREAKKNIRFKLSTSESMSPEDVEAEIICAMIDSWSFDEETSQANKIKFIKEAPQISDAIDLFSSYHGNFAKK
jgi:hypothetical protein